VGNWKEILSINDVNDGSLFVEIIGVYQNKLYFTDNEGFAYVDLSDNNYTRTSWINYDKKPSDILREFVIKNDKLYFCKGVVNTDDSINSSHIYSIYSIGFTDVSLDNAIKIIDNATIVKINDDKDLLYYMSGYTPNNSIESLYEYNLISREAKLLISNPRYYSIEDPNILYSEGFGEALYLYNIETNKSFMVSEYVDSFAIKNNDIYYVNENEGKLVKYDNGKNTVIYTYSDKDDPDYRFSDISFKNDIMILGFAKNDPVDGGSMEKYIVDGQIQEEVPTISVTMLDGTTKTYTIDLMENEK
jgi:hypothetical protein